jgi:predicted nucleotidyltransferase
MDAVEMAHRRWQYVSIEDRSALARRAALARWDYATDSDKASAKARAAHAREMRTKIIAARLLGVDVSKLADLKVRTVSPSEFRNQKSQEQAEYWKQLQEEPPSHSTHIDARRMAIVHPASFRLPVMAQHGRRS